MPFHVRICDSFEYFPFFLAVVCHAHAVRGGCLCSTRTHSVMHIEFQYCMIEIMHYLFTSCGRNGKTVKPNHGTAVAHIYTAKKRYTHYTKHETLKLIRIRLFILFFIFCGAYHSSNESTSISRI